MKGMIPAVMMNFLCEYNKKEIWELFDCIGGSSIGGIIAREVLELLTELIPWQIIMKL